MAAPVLSLAELRRDRRLKAPRVHPATPPRWDLEALAGRVIQVSGDGDDARLSTAASLARAAQQAGEPVVWLTPPDSGPYPPDLAAAGVDLNALVVVCTEGTRRILRAADALLRSGAFGLVIIDCPARFTLPLPAQSRLSGLAQKHDAVLLFLTETKENAPSLGSLVSLRAQSRRRRVAEGRFACELVALKDKRRGPGWRHEELCLGPPGVR